MKKRRNRKTHDSDRNGNVKQRIIKKGKKHNTRMNV